MFTMRDLRTIAVQIERNGEKLYRLASGLVQDPEAARLLEWLADEEAEHAKWFEHLPVSDTVEEGFAQLQALGSQLMQDALDQKTFGLDIDRLLEAGKWAEILEMAIEMEKETITFYQLLHAFVEQEDALEQLEAIIEEENRHVSKLTALLEGENNRQLGSDQKGNHRGRLS